jgi:AraC-like DNA-binding protein
MADEVFASMPLALLSFAAGKGLEPNRLMAAAGIRAEDLVDRDARVPYVCLPRMWAILLEEFPDEPLGLQYARTIDLSVAGVVGFVLKHSPNLDASLKAYTRYISLLDRHFLVGVERQGDVVRSWIDHEPTVVAMREPMEMFLASFTLLGEEMVGHPLPFDAVYIRHAQRHDTQHYREVFGDAELHFDAGWTGGLFSADLLHEPFSDYDPSICRYLEAHADALLAAQDEEEEDGTGAALDSRVRSAIDESLMSGDLHIEQVARRLAMSTRSLQRGLHALDTSFRDELDAVRRERALQLLERQELSVQDVAFMLGYADPRNFYRSFRRWTQMSPRSWRQRAS